MRGLKAPRLIYSSGRIAPLYWVRRREERKKLGGLRVRTASLGDWWLSPTPSVPAALGAVGARRRLLLELLGHLVAHAFPEAQQIDESPAGSVTHTSCGAAASPTWRSCSPTPPWRRPGRRVKPLLRTPRPRRRSPRRRSPWRSARSPTAATGLPPMAPAAAVAAARVLSPAAPTMQALAAAQRAVGTGEGPTATATAAAAMSVIATGWGASGAAAAAAAAAQIGAFAPVSRFGLVLVRVCVSAWPCCRAPRDARLTALATIFRYRRRHSPIGRRRGRSRSRSRSRDRGKRRSDRSLSRDRDRGLDRSGGRGRSRSPRGRSRSRSRDRGAPVRRDRDRYPGRDGARDKQPRRAAETDKAKAPQSYNEKLGHFKKETVQKKDVAEESFTVKLLFFALPLAKPTADVKLQVENALNGFGFKGIEMEEDEEGKHKGEALVRFRDIACAKRAHAFISGKNIKGTVYQACPEGQRPVAVVPAPIEVQQPTNQVEITNLIPDLTQMDIRERFKRYGTIKSVTVTRSPSGKVRLNNVAT